jgi:hypothetical protein
VSDDRADRLRVASFLLGVRDSEGVVRSPLPADQTMAAIRAMPAPERANLTAQINWVREYEANDMPERHSASAAGVAV